MKFGGTLQNLLLDIIVSLCKLKIFRVSTFIVEKLRILAAILDFAPK